METTKQTYFVDISSGEILEAPIDGSPNFRIFANEEDLAELQMWFTQNYDDDMKTFVRSHIPYVEPHIASQNDKYESSLKHIYSIIYRLGDEEARSFIEQQKILDLDFQAPNEDVQKLKE
ncbi:hydrolase [Peribacillus deserti]|uniref:Hydrolase n=1 Tax=Peribacillus deserti TaxID=673318 RepID=A0A2N5M883_9BACI|nr:hydrolase [Peribacillus deserti]PLT30569.1 hydrolase [Peribacillus deserti]